MLALVQKVDNDAGIHHQQEVPNQDHAVKPFFNMFPDNISSYNKEDTSPNSLDILLGHGIPIFFFLHQQKVRKVSFASNPGHLFIYQLLPSTINFDIHR